jgi:hypothetical protein
LYGQTNTQTFTTQDDLIEWRNKCYISRSYCTLPDTNVIDFETLYDELMLHTSKQMYNCLVIL